MAHNLDSSGKIILAADGRRGCCCGTEPCADDGFDYGVLQPCGTFTTCEGVTIVIPCQIIRNELLTGYSVGQVVKIYGICYTITAKGLTICEAIALECSPGGRKGTLFVDSEDVELIAGGCSDPACYSGQVVLLPRGCDGRAATPDPGSTVGYCYDGPCGFFASSFDDPTCTILDPAGPYARASLVASITDWTGMTLPEGRCCSCAEALISYGGGSVLAKCKGGTLPDSSIYCCCGLAVEGEGFFEFVDCTFAVTSYYFFRQEFPDGSWTQEVETFNASGKFAVGVPGASAGPLVNTYTDSTGANVVTSVTSTALGGAGGFGDRCTDWEPNRTDRAEFVATAVAASDPYASMVEDGCNAAAYSYAKDETVDGIRTILNITVGLTKACNPSSPCTGGCGSSAFDFFGGI